MSFADHKLIDNSLGDTMLDVLEEKRKGDFKIYGGTFVNLLGKDGNFEVDTNVDGLADGWTNDAGLTAVANTMNTAYEYFGSKCQKITLSADGEGGNYVEVSVAAAQALLVAGYIRAGDTSTTGKLIVDWRDIADAQISTDTVGTNATARYVRKSALLTAPANTVKARIYATVAGVSGKLAYFVGIQVNNLTAQGALDPVRAAKYGVSNWSDLTEAQLEAEIPYFDSVMSVNVEDGTASELTIENRGKNLANFERYDNSSIFMIINTQLKIGNTYTLKINNIDALPDGDFFFRIAKLPGSGATETLFDLLGTKTTTPTFTYTRAMKNVKYRFWIVNYSNPFISQEFVDNLNIQLEEGSVATDYVPPREDSITIPDTCELHALEGYHDYIEYDADSEKLLHVSFIARDNKTTDASGDFALTGVLSGSNVLVRNKTTGAVEWCTESSGSVHTSTISDDVEIWYIRSTATSTEIYGLYSGNFLKALKNNIVIDSNLPVAMKINDSNQSGYIITQDFTE